MRAGTANIGDGKNIKRDQSTLGANQRRESGDHINIGKILLLCNRRHLQMHLNNPSHQISISFAETVQAGLAHFFAEQAGVFFS